MPIQIAAPMPSSGPLVEPSTLDIVAKLLVLVLAAALFIALQATLLTPLPDERCRRSRDLDVSRLGSNSALMSRSTSRSGVTR